MRWPQRSSGSPGRRGRRVTFGCGTGSPGCTEVEFDGFIASNFDSPLSLLTPQLARLAALGAFRRWDRVVKRFITDPRLHRIFTFQALYAGVPPQRALAVYAVIAYMDTIAGVYFPRGGMRALPDALAAAAADAGVEFRYGSTVSDWIAAGPRDGRGHRPGRAHPRRCGGAHHRTARHLSAAGPHAAPAAAAAARRRPRWSPTSAAAPSDREIPHHHILFGDAWEQTFRDIIDDGVVMRDPSLLVTRPTAGDPTLAPTGRDLLYILAPAPNLLQGTVDWAAVGDSYADEMIDAVTDRLPQLGADAELLHVVNPADWARQGMAAGTPFALAHTFAQTGPFRPANTVRGIDNVVLAGSSTVPGVGVPTALLSGRLAADRITGAGTRASRPTSGAAAHARSKDDDSDALRTRRRRRARSCPA